MVEGSRLKDPIVEDPNVEERRGYRKTWELARILAVKSRWIPHN
jgi:hypothetical protein